jgi:hypothetical protein
MGALRHGLITARLVLVPVLALVLALFPALTAFADYSGSGTKGGSRIKARLPKEALQNLHEGKSVGGQPDPQRYEYTSVTNCPGSRPGAPTAGDFCEAAAVACAGNTAAEGLGPSLRVYRRPVDDGGRATGPWEQVGITCFPDLVPGARPTLGMAQILAAFHDTDFARADLDIQPRGNVTLVTLPTYFALRWPQAGFAPGEIDRPDPARLLGYRVEIRPALQSVTYHFGDGTSLGPTTSAGGSYPEGDVTKAYDQPGTYAVRADVAYTGQFRVGGGAWIDIPATVTIRGTEETLTVRTARARLHSSD